MAKSLKEEKAKKKENEEARKKDNEITFKIGHHYTPLSHTCIDNPFLKTFIMADSASKRAKEDDRNKKEKMQEEK